MPLRIEIGGRDLPAPGRHYRSPGHWRERQIPLAHVCPTINELLSEVQRSLYRNAFDEQELEAS
jgi:hypothetical protein